MKGEAIYIVLEFLVIICNTKLWSEATQGKQFAHTVHVIGTKKRESFKLTSVMPLRPVKFVISRR